MPRIRCRPGICSREPVMSAIRLCPSATRCRTAASIPDAWSLQATLAFISGGRTRSTRTTGPFDARIASIVAGLVSLASERIIPSTRRLWKNRMCAASNAGWFSEFISSSE